MPRFEPDGKSTSKPLPSGFTGCFFSSEFIQKHISFKIQDMNNIHADPYFNPDSKMVRCKHSDHLRCDPDVPPRPCSGAGFPGGGPPPLSGAPRGLGGRGAAGRSGRARAQRCRLPHQCAFLVGCVQYIYIYCTYTVYAFCNCTFRFRIDLVFFPLLSFVFVY